MSEPQEFTRYRFVIVGLMAFLAFAFGLNLFAVDLTGAILTGVIGADFTGTLNVPKK